MSISPKKPMNPKRRPHVGTNPSAPRKPRAPSPATLEAHPEGNAPVTAMACGCLLATRTQGMNRIVYMDARTINATAFVSGIGYLRFVCCCWHFPRACIRKPRPRHNRKLGRLRDGMLSELYEKQPPCRNRGSYALGFKCSEKTDFCAIDMAKRLKRRSVPFPCTERVEKTAAFLLHIRREASCFVSSRQDRRERNRYGCAITHKAGRAAQLLLTLVKRPIHMLGWRFLGM
jgi:hypothetical protein